MHGLQNKTEANAIVRIYDNDNSPFTSIVSGILKNIYCDDKMLDSSKEHLLIDFVAETTKEDFDAWPNIVKLYKN